MSVILNSQCPECAKNGADKFGKYLMTFDDGGKLCIHSHNHTSGERYYVKPDGTDPLTSSPIDGKLKYTPAQFHKLVEDGLINDEFTRKLAMGGMRMADRFAVMNEEEVAATEAEWALDVEWFNQLSTKSLVDRGIHGLIAKLYNVRVGHDEKGVINRHYYPSYTRDTMEVTGAKARTLPKDFRSGHLGRRFGADLAMFGMQTTQAVLDSGTFRKGKMGKLLVVGGEADSMAAQQIILKAINRLDGMQGLKTLEGLKLAHVWSPNKGEMSLEEVVNNREFIDQFEEVVWAFDNDDVGNALNLACSRLFRQKSKFFIYPQGMKDANDCLKAGREKEFMDSWWNPTEARVKGKLKSASNWAAKAKEVTVMGLPYFCPALNPITFGLRTHYLHVWAAGTGVGKTEITTKHIASLIEQGQPVVAIYLENSPDEVIKMVAGAIANKDFMSPPLSDEERENSYNEARDYTYEDLARAIDDLTSRNLLIIPDLEGSKDVNVIMDAMRDALALGYMWFVVDNLTAFEHHVDGKVQVGTQAIDETMKQIGGFKDENPVNIMLLSHCSRPDKNRTPHELGGEVFITDIRGAGSISFWANGVWSAERNTQADSLQDKCTTLIRNLKSRGVGHKVGTVVVLRKDLETGQFIHIPHLFELPQVGRKKDKEESGAGGYPRKENKARQLIDEAIDENAEF